jgi:Polyketide cyclase / dehydrase and lipid transport
MASEGRDGDHDQVRRMVSLPVDRETVWGAIGGFGLIEQWHPLIERAELTEIDGEAYRHVTTTDGKRFLERLIEAGPHHFTYEMIDGPLPVTDHRATLSCVAEPNGCHVYWSAYFVPTGSDAHLADEIVGAFYEIGLRAIRDRFGAEPADQPQEPPAP